MAEFFEDLNDDLIAFIKEQLVFFVATAPLEGRISLSPKGMDTLRVLNEKTVAYLDLVGSAAETAAHARQNGRLTMMFCSFGKKPLILRLYGKARVISSEDESRRELLALFPEHIGRRQIIVLDIESLQTSCGYGVPIFEGGRERETLRKWAENKGEEGLRKYVQENNKLSIDGLPTGL